MKKLLEETKNNKLLSILGILIVLVFIFLIMRVSYAYFEPVVGDGKQKDITITSDAVSQLSFNIGDPLSLTASSETLPENGSNLVKTTTSSASLKAGATGSATDNYFVYFKISNNTFVYTKENTPEIILTITDANNNPVTNIEGLVYGTFNGIAGFDVTNANGTFLVGTKEITSTSTTDATTEVWNYTLTYLNLEFDQSINFGHSLTTEIMMKKERI